MRVRLLARMRLRVLRMAFRDAMLLFSFRVRPRTLRGYFLATSLLRPGVLSATTPHSLPSQSRLTGCAHDSPCSVSRQTGRCVQWRCRAFWSTRLRIPSMPVLQLGFAARIGPPKFASPSFPLPTLHHHPTALPVCMYKLAALQEF